MSDHVLLDLLNDKLKRVKKRCFLSILLPFLQ